MNRWWRVAGGAVVLAVVVERVGTGPFVDAARSTSPVAVVAALAITAVTTVCCAWRWQAVADRLGVDVPLRSAMGAYYRSQFLNATLPGGVVGDVQRAWRHGAKPVVAERTIGQVVQVVATVAVLLVGPLPWLALAAGLLAVAAAVRWPVVVLASLLAAGGHVVVFLVAARAAGTDASLPDLLPLALVVLLAAAIPLNVAGWGPREGVAAWSFAAAGLGAGQGATVAVVYGVLALVATLPGGVLMAKGAVRG
jgi:uncharacterized membrane protein YbhN (UPF0104 family)